MSNIRRVIEHYTDFSGEKLCCPIHKENTPSLQVYEDTNSWYCWGACGEGGDEIEFVKSIDGVDFPEAVKKVCEILKMTKEEFMESKDKEKVEAKVVVENAEAMDSDDVKALIQSTGYVSHGYRGIRDEINKFFGHLTKLDDQWNVIARYYPETNNKGKLTGYKCRNTPKDFSFGKVGATGNKSQLSGQVKFKGVGKYVLYVGGEEDKAAAYQMLYDAQKDQDFTATPVVSPTSGEGSAAKQAAMQYDFFDQFEFIIIGMDNDEAGRKAAKEIAEVLPKNKVKIATWTMKDPNKMLEEGKQKQFIRDFWNAKEYVSSGILNSTEMMPSVIEELLRPRISLPPHMHRLESAMGGGLLQGRIINIIGDTSVGKSTHVNGMVYHWMYNAPEKVGVVSLEATAGQYSLDMLSLHLEKNLMWAGEGQEVIDFLQQPEVVAKTDDLWADENGKPRWAILDERDGDIKNLERQVERLIHQFGCMIIVIDVLTDILRSLPMDQQEEHMKWQKKIIKSGVTIINVLHTRKPGQSPDGKIRKVTEYDALGSGSFVQSAAVNIVINRDKMIEGYEKNVTWVDLPKCRGGKTGEIGGWYFDWKTRKVYDYEDWILTQNQSQYDQDPQVDVDF